MKPEDLVTIIRAHRKETNDSELTENRAEAYDRYHGRPYGDEQPGRSQVVTKDLAETVDWIMPSIMRVLLQSGQLAEFTPVGEEDEELAEQQSDYTQLVIMRDNPGFLVLHDAIKDGLLLKNLYAKHWWDENKIVRERKYTKVTELELALIFQKLAQNEGEYEITEQEQLDLKENPPLPDGSPDPEPRYNVTIKYTRKVNRVKLCATANEELKVSTKCRGSLQDSPYTEWETTKTRSELIEMGMPKDFVQKLSKSGEERGDDTREADARDPVSDIEDTSENAFDDTSMDEIRYCEVFLKVDYDGDGIAELRRVVLADDQIPPGNDWNMMVDAVGFTGGQVKRVPHRHVGESLHDDLQDLAKIKTVLTRQLLDNIYHTNNTQWVVNERVNLEDFLMSIPGGVKRIADKGAVGDSVMPVPVPSIVDKLIPAIDYVESLKENRTGINKATTGQDPDVLKQSTKGAFLENLNRASMKVEMMTRMIAETFVKELVLQVHALIIKHQDFSRTVKLRGKYVPINPDEWEERTDLTVNVGLGTGTMEEKMNKLGLLGELQGSLIEQGLVGPEQSFNMFKEMASALGVENPEKFVINPQTPEFQQNKMYLMGRAVEAQNQGNPLAEAEMIKAEAAKEIAQFKETLKRETDAAKIQSERELAELKHMIDMENKDRDRDLKLVLEDMSNRTQAAIAEANNETKALIEGLKIDLGPQGAGEGLDRIFQYDPETETLL